jgi:4-cresol dehydrogenase (hydroxylating)
MNNSGGNLAAIQNALLTALTEFEVILGSENILSGSSQLQAYSHDTGPRIQTVLAALRPGSVSQLQGIVEIASKHELPLYPISRGCNWGYGSASPATPHNIVIDLSRMNGIAELNRELAYVVIEPGVTQQQLSDYLEEHAPELFFDVTGASPQASILANTLERGYGFTQYADHFLNFACMEVVLADGDVLQTGFGQFENASSTYLHKWGIGPILDGLFTQSNFGVVTKIGLWLMPRPERLGAINLNFKSDQEFIDAIPAIRDLKLQGYLKGSLHLANEMRVMSAFQQFPFQDKQGGSCLSTDTRQRLMRKWDINAWNGIGGMWGAKSIVAAEFKYIKRKIGKRGKLRFISDSAVQFLSRHQWIYKLLKGHSIEPRLALFSLLRGKPTEGPMLAPYWMKKDAAPSSNRDPVRDRCGVSWCSPVVPLTSSSISQFLTVSREIHERFGIDFNTNVSILNERAAVCTVGIFYDLQNEQETKNAEQCYQELSRSYTIFGFLPYRSGSDPSKSKFFSTRKPASVKILQSLKNALDPKNIIAPGRYGLGM